jgi:predicted glycosyltransferase
MNIWIDLDNSPHVPFFAPIIQELERRGHSVTLTARDAFQVCELANLFGLTYKRVGRHYGKHRVLKAYGLCVRALQLFPTALSAKPDLALSHGSRSQLLVAAITRIPSVVILDYEFAKHLVFFRPAWVIAPEVIPSSAIHYDKRRVLRYPGIKEDVYVPGFKPDPSIKAQLGLNGDSVVVTVRPPASEAHYHNPQSDELFDAAIEFLGRAPNTKIVLLPRNGRQETSVRRAWPNLFSTRKIIIPEHAIDGLNLMWHSDLVISGGGTMNREAAALGVPVYSIFRGRIGAVDRYLADTGRLVLLQSPEDVRTKLILDRRPQPLKPRQANSDTLRAIVDDIAEVVEWKCRMASRQAAH